MWYRVCEHVLRFLTIFLPSLRTIIIVKVDEDYKGKTLGRVSTTYVTVRIDVLKETEKSFSVAVIVDPKPKQTD